MQPSQNREDYLKFLYEHASGEPISNKAIAEGLKIAPPSVSEMMQRLHEQGLVHHIPYRGVNLTPEGKRLARDLVRKHEIWEYFLAKKLGYNEIEVHELAEVLEHATPMDLAERLAVYMDYPEEERVEEDD